MTAVVTARHTADGVPAEQGFVSGFLLFGGVAALAMVVSLLIPGRYLMTVKPSLSLSFISRVIGAISSLAVETQSLATGNG